MKFSEEIKDSPTLKIAEFAKNKANEGSKVISLAIGEPDFKTPSYIIEETKLALDQGYTTYSTPQGLIELRRAIKNDYLKRYQANYDESEIIIFPGAKNAIYLALSALLEENDEVIIISPYYVSYPPMIKLAEPTAKIIELKLNSDFSLPVNEITTAITKNTKLLILNYPNNPTGMLLSKKETEAVVKLVKENNIYLLSDEIYDRLVFSNEEFISFSKFTEIKNKMIIINGYSKTYAMTGFRVGYALSNQKLIKKMNLMNQNTNTNTNTFVQRGILSIYKNKETHLKPYLKLLNERANYLHKALNEIKYFKGIKPKSAFYYFLDISKTGLNSSEFSELLINNYGIAVTPGIAFGKAFDDHVRLSLAVDLKTIKEAIEILKEIKF